MGLHDLSANLGSFNNLSDNDRVVLCRQYLIQDDSVVIHPLVEPGMLNPDIAPGLPLLDEYIMGRDSMRRIMLQTAREVYYGQNEFLVHWEGLGEFLTASEKSRGDAGSLVRKIIVRYDTRDEYDTKLKFPSELSHLFRLTCPKKIVLEIFGTGTPEGSDEETQSVLKHISAIVGKLLQHFGDCFTVQKSLGGRLLLHNPKSFDLRSYWETPSLAAKTKMQCGEATFEEAMQVQVNGWTSSMHYDNLPNQVFQVVDDPAFTDVTSHHTTLAKLLHHNHAEDFEL